VLNCLLCNSRSGFSKGLLVKVQTRRTAEARAVDSSGGQLLSKIDEEATTSKYGSDTGAASAINQIDVSKSSMGSKASQRYRYIDYDRDTLSEVTMDSASKTMQAPKKPLVPAKSLTRKKASTTVLVDDAAEVGLAVYLPTLKKVKKRKAKKLPASTR
jgi:hypothetical protein